MGVKKTKDRNLGKTTVEEKNRWVGQSLCVCMCVCEISAEVSSFLKNLTAYRNDFCTPPSADCALNCLGVIARSEIQFSFSCFIK